MDFLRLVDKEIGGDIGGDGIAAASLTDGDTGKFAFETQEKDLRTASKIESARGIERVQNIFICDFDRRGSGVSDLLDSAESKAGLHSHSCPLPDSNAGVEPKEPGNQAQIHPVPGRMCIHKLI